MLGTPGVVSEMLFSQDQCHLSAPLEKVLSDNPSLLPAQVPHDPLCDLKNNGELFSGGEEPANTVHWEERGLWRQTLVSSPSRAAAVL